MTTKCAVLWIIPALLIMPVLPTATWAQDSETSATNAVAEATGILAPANESPAAQEVEHLLDDLERRSKEYRELRTREQSLEGEEFLVARLQQRNHLLAFMQSVDELVEALRGQEGSGVDRPRGRRRTRALLRDLDRRIPSFLDMLADEAGRLRAELEGAAPDEDRAVRELIQGNEEITDEVFHFFVDHLGRLNVLGLPDTVSRAQLIDRLPRRADDVMGRLLLISTRLANLRADQEGSEGDTELRASIHLAEEQLDAVASSLWTTSDLMDELGLPTASYRQALIRATGEITGDVLNVEVATGLLETAWHGALRWIERRGPTALTKMALFVAVVFAFWILGTGVRVLVERGLRRSNNVSELARRTLINLVRRLIVIGGVLFALTQLGIQVSALLAGVGIVGFIVGFALQDTLANFAAGAMILTYRPFDVGDVVEAGGVFGTVHNNTLVSTTILTFDNQTLVVPNSKIWGDVIRNVTAQKLRRIDLSFGLSHEVDIEAAERVFEKLLRDHDKVLEDPHAEIRVHKLTETAVEFVVRPWARREDYWDVYWDLTREAKLRLDAAGLPLAVPRRQVALDR